MIAFTGTQMLEFNLLEAQFSSNYSQNYTHNPIPGIELWA